MSLRIYADIAQLTQPHLMSATGTLAADPSRSPNVCNGSKAAARRLAAGMGGKPTLGRPSKADAIRSQPCASAISWPKSATRAGNLERGQMAILAGP